MLNGVIITDGSKCRQCYSCVRNCPVKAVRIKDGKAEVIQNRCIQCGQCVKHCSRNAKKIESAVATVKVLLKSGHKKIAILAPSYPVGLYPMSCSKIINLLDRIGFDEVWEAAIGGDSVIEASTRQYLAMQCSKDTNTGKNHNVLITSSCTAFVNMLEKHFPNLTEYLISICSPMVATARLIRQKHRGQQVHIVFIGPCIAKKDEIRQAQFEGLIDAVMTYNEAQVMFGELDLCHNFKEREIPYYTASPEGRRIPLSGGIIANLSQQFTNRELFACDGMANCMELIKHLENIHIEDKLNNRKSLVLYDVLGCNGCIDGACIENGLSVFDKIKTITDFADEECAYPNTIPFDGCDDIDLTRNYQNRCIPIGLPSEYQIQKILASMDKFNREDELNCGACGYESCRDKALAVYQGIAEVEMCIPYLLSKKNELYQKLCERFDTINDLNEHLNAIFESSYDGMIVCDSNGNILKTNSAWRNMFGLDNVTGNIREIEDKKVIYPSVTLLAIKEKRRVTFLQESKSHKRFISTGNPIWDKKGNLLGVVTNTRDIDDLNRLKDSVLKDSQPTVQAPVYSGIIANSQEFGKVVEMAVKAAQYQSTVLLTGETGVGKDVVARLIHHLSTAKAGPFISVNCGAIPEHLLESEFFGYEAGAFTGASKDGKLGFFEAAHKGTIFLDEIGDLPLLLQVKLLQVIQEKRIRRLGATGSKVVNLRIIAATNQDLKKMVSDAQFREDLYYRLNVIPIHIPPLRERKDDIRPLSYHFLEVYNHQYGCKKSFTSGVESILYHYFWPGNVRELQNMIERLVVTSREMEISARDFPPYMTHQKDVADRQIIVNQILPLKEAVSEVERQLINRAYKVYGNTYKMADVLGVNQSTVVRKMKQLKE